MKKRLGILTGGGDCPGLNNAIKQIVLDAQHHGFTVEGLTEGWKGPLMYLSGKAPLRTITLPLNIVAVRRVNREGGTMLMSSRANPFRYQEQDLSDKMVDFLNGRYHSVITIGGEDTNGAAGRLVLKGARLIGVPKTIDKDLCGTDVTLGFESAVDFVAESLYRLRSTAGSHGTVYFVEIMGRHAGHLAYHGALAGDAHFLTIPEVEIEPEELYERIAERRGSLPMQRGYTRDGRRYAIVAIAEGTRPKGEGLIGEEKVDDHNNRYITGVARRFAEGFKVATGYDVRVCELRHLQRGGSPSHKDRILGRMFGKHAVALAEEGTFGRMVAIQQNSITDVPLEMVIGRMRVLDASECYDAKNCIPIPGTKLYHEVEVAKPNND